MRSKINACIFLGIIVLSGFSSLNSNAQDISSQDKQLIQALGKSAFKKGSNIKFGAGYGSFHAYENLRPQKNFFNVFGIFVAYNNSVPILDHQNTFWDMEFQFGKRQYKSSPFYSDTVSITNFSSYEHFYLEFPFQVAFRKSIANNVYYGIKPGFYFNWMPGGELKNNTLSREAITYMNAPHPDYKSLDFGGIFGFEFGIRAAFIGLDYRFGLKNLTPEHLKETHTIKNKGFFSINAGYRFGTEMGKSDINKINNIL